MLVNGCVTCKDTLADMITGECDRCWKARREFVFIDDWGAYKKGDRIKEADIGDGVIFKELYFGTEANMYSDKKIKDDTPAAPWCCEHCDHLKNKCVC